MKLLSSKKNTMKNVKIQFTPCLVVARAAHAPVSDSYVCTTVGSTRGMQTSTFKNAFQNRIQLVSSSFAVARSGKEGLFVVKPIYLRNRLI